MNRPDRSPDVVIEGQSYWKVRMSDGGHAIYSVGCLGDYYFSVFDTMMWDDEPEELHEWYKNNLPTGLVEL
jgi:hypothetical protein